MSWARSWVFLTSASGDIRSLVLVWRFVALAAISKEQLDILRQADKILIDEIRAAGEYEKIGQALVVLLPVRSVGVMGDGRTYEQVRLVRCYEA